MSKVSGNAEGLEQGVLTGQVSVPESPPECPDHREVQHRGGKPPWCKACGWRHGRPAIPARRIR